MIPPPESPAHSRLSTGEIVSYSLPIFGLGFMFMFMNVYLLKYSADVLLISAGTIGVIFGVSRLWDAVSDPLIGYLSDRTRTRLGRRRPWLLAGALPMAITFAMMWSPPRDLEHGALTAWMVVAIFGFYTAMTMVDLPHGSLGAEMSDDYHERTRIFGIRRLLFGVGSFAAFLGIDAPREVVVPLAYAGGALGLGLVVLTAVRVRERAEFQGRGSRSPWTAIGDVWRNPHARLLLAMFFVQQIGLVSLTVVMPFFSEYVVATPGYTGAYLVTMMGSSVLAIPVWLRIAPRFQKKHLVITAMLLASLAISGLFFTGEGEVGWIFAIAVVGGIASGGADVILPSMQADIIDFDEYRTGQRKEGSYFAAWAFAAKTAGGLAVMITGLVLDWVGFEPNAVQTDQVKLALRTLVALGPAVLYTIGVLIFLRFGLNVAEHAEIRLALDVRRNARRAAP